MVRCHAGEMLVALSLMLAVPTAARVRVLPDGIAISKAIPKVGDEVLIRVQVQPRQVEETDSLKLRLQVQGPDGERSFGADSRLFANPMGSAEAVFSWTPGRNGWHKLRIILPDGEGPSLQVPVVQREVHIGWYGPFEEPPFPRYMTLGMNIRDADRDVWLRRGVIPAAWKGGNCYGDWSREKFLESWSQPKWIAIDEFMGPPEVREKLTWALKELKRRHPDHFVALWLGSGYLSQELGQAVDLFMPEVYLNYHNNHLGHLTRAVKKARQEGVPDKTIIGLGLNDREHGAPTDPTRELVLRQFRHLKRIAPDLPGLAFFNFYGAPPGMVEYVDRLCYDYFIGPLVTLTDAKLRLSGDSFHAGEKVSLAAEIRNIGNMDVRGALRVKLVDDNGHRLALLKVEDLRVGEERTVQFDVPMPKGIHVVKAQVLRSSGYAILDGSAQAVLANAQWPRLKSHRQLIVAVPPVQGGRDSIAELPLDDSLKPKNERIAVIEYGQDGHPLGEVASEQAGDTVCWILPGKTDSWRFFGLYTVPVTAQSVAPVVSRSNDGMIVAQNTDIRMVIDPSKDAVTDLRLSNADRNILGGPWTMSCPGYQDFGEPMVHEGPLFATITIPFRSELAEGETIYRFPRMGGAIEITRRFKPLKAMEIKGASEGASFKQQGGTYALQAGVGAFMERGTLQDTSEYRDLLFGYLGGHPAEENSTLCGWFDFSCPEKIGGGLGVAIRKRWRDAASRTYDVTRYYDAADRIDIYYVYNHPTLIGREQTSTVYLIPHAAMDLTDDDVVPPAKAVWEALHTPVVRCNDGRVESR